MRQLECTNNKLVCIAIGTDSDEFGHWFVQTTDLQDGTNLSETIEENLYSEEHAIAIASLYVDEYDFMFINFEE